MIRISDRVSKALAVSSNLYQFFYGSTYSKLRHDPEVANFVFGNPQELPLPDLVSTLKNWASPQNKDWFAYKDSEPFAQEAVAKSLFKRLGVPFLASDISMTNGAFAAITASVATLINDGDEVIYMSPPWFFYESIILTWGGIPVKIKINMQNFDLDLEAIANALSKKTRMVIINSPHNPTGKIYSETTLKALAKLLSDHGKRVGHPIFLLSDESYCKIVFDNRACPSSAQFYDHTLLIYTYAKTLLAPGQRIGYVALSPNMPDKEMLRMALFVAQANAGYLFPNAIMQYAVADLEKMSLDLITLQKRRDLVVNSLASMGYEPSCPEGTFYIVVKSPWADDLAFCEHLAKHRILCLPGSALELPGYFRISLTASDTMVERALPGFKKALNNLGQKSADFVHCADKMQEKV